MKNLKKIILFVIVILLQQCGPKEKVELSTIETDSVLVKSNGLDTATSIIEKDTVLTKVIEDLKKETTVKSTLKTPESTKKTVKQEVKTVTEQKVEEVLKKETPVEKLIEKKEEVKKEAVVVKEEVKTVVNTTTSIIEEKVKNIKNPINTSAENLKEGKYLFDLHCKVCHGAKGLGDGAKAKSMKGDLGDFSSEKFQAQSDGALFNKTKSKVGDHPGFAKKLSDDDIWLVINYIRTLKK